MKNSTEQQFIQKGTLKEGKRRQRGKEWIRKRQSRSRVQDGEEKNLSKERAKATKKDEAKLWQAQVQQIYQP